MIGCAPFAAAAAMISALDSGIASSQSAYQCPLPPLAVVHCTADDCADASAHIPSDAADATAPAIRTLFIFIICKSPEGLEIKPSSGTLCSGKSRFLDFFFSCTPCQTLNPITALIARATVVHQARITIRRRRSADRLAGASALDANALPNCSVLSRLVLTANACSRARSIP